HGGRPPFTRDILPESESRGGIFPGQRRNCSGTVSIDFSHMKDGDRAGFCAFNGNSGVLTLKCTGKTVTLEMSEQVVALTDREKAVSNVDEKVVESVPLAKNTKQIWLRIDGDFQPGHHDAANFFYSLDGENWTQIGTKNYRMQFDYRRFFMGTKFAIFNYATKRAGGYVDVDYFNGPTPQPLRKGGE
ncbi:MAG: hypothetical protein J6W69_06745, partial [Bacteroidales bacterium]|nr:hypothetical protein [Bacteroidales bacterium]